MAYYPGDYYQNRCLPDYYSQNLFTTSSNNPSDLPVYDTPQPYDDHPSDHPLPSSSPQPYSPPPFMSPPSLGHHRERSPQPPRSRSVTPPPPPTPSPSYLEFTAIPSKSLSEPTRKLLVLDLNGTLLLRSPRPPKSSRGQYHQLQRPAPRRVMRRPYLTTLRAYLFAPQTQAWLDVMVWSSAQPHSVEDMVQHAFGGDRDRLVAIWARDTLGLAENHYHRKVQTTKDLEKPWVHLASPHHSPTIAPPNTSPHALPAAPKSDRSSPQRATWSGHSAATTILLDDSHAKAAFQPYNHLCVPEYTREQRNADLAALQHSRILSLRAAQHGSANGQLQPQLQGHKKRKRTHEPRSSEEETTADAVAEGESPVVDETLLAVIGILHAARVQSSVAGWLRAGALVARGREGREKREKREQGAVWFEDAALVRQWARRGRQAMRALGLEVQHGVEP